MSDCPRIGRMFGGCKFKPRYDAIGAVDATMSGFWYSGPASAYPRPTPARKTYLCDVCERCGKTLFRRKNAAGTQAAGVEGE